MPRVGKTAFADGGYLIARLPRSLTSLALKRSCLSVLMVLSVLGGCAGRLENVLLPLAAAGPGTSAVDMMVATTRQPTNKPGELYSGERGTAISLNDIVVSIPPDRNRKIGEVQWPSHVPANPEKEFAVLKVGRVASERDIFEWFSKNRNAKRQVVIFVHGFNNTYSDAVFRFAQIIHDSGTDAAPILFTWPSRGNVFDYLYDKESTNFSRRALEDLILQSAKSPDVGEVTILAHSMGSWLTAEALRGVAMRNKTIPAKVKNVILASPDIDIDVFRRQMIEMGPQRPHFTIFSSTRDKALQVSRWLSGGVNRVGGFDSTPYAADLAKLGITVIDTSSVKPDDALGHNTFADNRDMVQLLGQRLAGQSLDTRQVSLADRVGMAAVRTADLAGSAAKVAVAAPMSIISDDARQVLKQQLSSGSSPIVDGRISY
ncbi:alpha/beta hydrolase [Rhizobium sp. BR 315]|uniref:Esterase/lipase superfamily enzyme n=2 Tax=Rhizobium/Agrobacterium group TaxID=227290 RepID=A0A1C3W932_9HYPH|nr:alpha/beta hydrolase [Rhizobium miluonense]SCB36328.1 Esterase/lipase superfamily enzyme [Rhizobium miluonense]